MTNEQYGNTDAMQIAKYDDQLRAAKREGMEHAAKLAEYRAEKFPEDSGVHQQLENVAFIIRKASDPDGWDPLSDKAKANTDASEHICDLNRLLNGDCSICGNTDAILAIIPAQERRDQPVGGWRSMDSAPKDGSEVLAYVGPGYKGGSLILGFFSENGHSAWRDWDHEIWEPTAWMPLPPAPGDQPEVMATSGAEQRWIEDMENACPHCGGSGHKDDVTQPDPMANGGVNG